MRASLAPNRSSHHPFADFCRLRRFSILAVLVFLSTSPITSCIEPNLRPAVARRRVTIPVGGGQDLLLPVTFWGDLPCGDCIARRVTLTLRPDTLFMARTTWVGDPEPNESYDLGRWVLDAARRRLILEGGTSDTLRISMIDATAIRLLDVDATDSAGGGGAATLVRARPVERFDEALRLRGFFLRTRGGAIFSECASGKRWPIAAEAAYHVLDRAYRVARKAPGAPLLVSVDGRLVLRRGSSGEREMVVIERVNHLWREGDCQNDTSTPERSRSPWRLVHAMAAPALASLSRARARGHNARDGG